MQHLFVDAPTKEELKELLKFSQVPFCVVVDKVSPGLTCFRNVMTHYCLTTIEYAHSCIWKS